jgi:ferredoxin
VAETVRGRTLRAPFLDGGLSPYTRLTDRANCGGYGLCATRGVRFTEGGPAPDGPHDRLADASGSPRLSCRVTVDADLVVELPQRLDWGGREP